MTASKEIKAAFCYAGSATYSNVVVTHIGSTLEIAAPASTVSWDGTGDLFVPVTVAAAGVKVNGAAVDAENYSLKNFGLTLKKAYLDSLSANAYAVELTGVSEPFGFIAVKGDVVARKPGGRQSRGAEPDLEHILFDGRTGELCGRGLLYDRV